MNKSGNQFFFLSLLLTIFFLEQKYGHTKYTRETKEGKQTTKVNYCFQVTASAPFSPFGLLTHTVCRAENHHGH